MDEDARRSHGQPALWDAIAIREERVKNIPRISSNIYPPRAQPLQDSTASSRRMGCSTNAIMAASDIDRAAPADAARPGRPALISRWTTAPLPSQSRIHFLECSGNPAYTKPFGKTASDLVGLLSCAE